MLYPQHLSQETPQKRFEPPQFFERDGRPTPLAPCALYRHTDYPSN